MNFLGILTAIFFSISIFFSFFCISVLFPEQHQSSKYKIIQWKLSSRETPARINPILIAIALKIPCLRSMVPINLLWTVDVGLLGFKAVLIRKRWMQYTNVCNSFWTWLKERRPSLCGVIYQGRSQVFDDMFAISILYNSARVYFAKFVRIYPIFMFIIFHTSKGYKNTLLLY